MVSQRLALTVSRHCQGRVDLLGRPQDRKSTRLNSSHSQISYAVFCLKKKTKTTDRAPAARRTTAYPASRLLHCLSPPLRPPPRVNSRHRLSVCAHTSVICHVTPVHHP